MGYEQYGLALRLKTSHDLHQFVDLLRGKYRGRLVKYQYFIIAVKHFEYFHSLLHSHGYIRYISIRVYFKPVFLGQRHHLTARFLLFKKAGGGGLDPENNIFKNGEHLNQLEMLVHHSDMKIVGVVRIVYLHDLAVLFYYSAVRLIQTEQHAHQRGFTCTVLAEQRMYLAAPKS